MRYFFTLQLVYVTYNFLKLTTFFCRRQKVIFSKVYHTYSYATFSSVTEINFFEQYCLRPENTLKGGLFFISVYFLYKERGVNDLIECQMGTGLRDIE